MRLYGTVEYVQDKNEWAITTEPHIAIRLKNIFRKIDTRKYKTLHISATPENSRDLQWFTLRYPLLVKQPDILQAKADYHREKETVFAALMRGEGRIEVPDMKIPAREYQLIAAQAWITSKGLLLADDVGTGKTASAIAGFNRSYMLPALVTTLTHLPWQWEAEIQRFTGLSTHILRKATPYDITKYHDGKMPDVIITGYSKLSGWGEVLGGGVVKSVVFDEAHELRHSGSNKYAAAEHIARSVEYVETLSATPIFNYGGEIYNILEITSPGAIGTWEEFVREWCTPLHNGKYKITHPEAFGAYLKESGLMLRRTRKDVGREIPEVTTIPHHIQCDPSILMKMQGDAVELARLILKQGPEDFKGQRMRAAGDFDSKMRQATGLSKANYVADFVKMLHEESGEKLVLYGWHRAVYDIWMEKLSHLNPVLYTGTESPTQKEAAKKAFVEGDSQVMIISLRSGAGLDGLQHVCKTVVFGELDWSPSCLLQNVGRVHRDGQNDPVVAYYLLSTQGSDPIMSDVLGIKKAQLEGIINPDHPNEEVMAVDPDHIKKLAERFLQDHTSKE